MPTPGGELRQVVRAERDFHGVGETQQQVDVDASESRVIRQAARVSEPRGHVVVVDVRVVCWVERGLLVRPRRLQIKIKGE